MLIVRTFLNTDSPALLRIWEKRAEINPEHFRPLSMQLLEQHVLGKPFFDPNGLFLAFDDAKPVGFAHAAFGPNDGHTGLDSATGVICMMMILPDYHHRDAVADLLLVSCEKYLIEKGAKKIYGGAVRPAAPFYMGLYGGSEPLGVFESDTVCNNLFSRSSYQIPHHTLLFRTSLLNYRIPITPKTVQWRRKIRLECTDLLTPSHWWEACMMCNFQWFKVQGMIAGESEPAGAVIARITDSAEMPAFPVAFSPNGDSWDFNRHARSLVAGLMNIWVQEKKQHQGLATYLLGEMARELKKRYVTLFEAQAAEENEPLVGLLQSMKWHIADRGAVFLKEV